MAFVSRIRLVRTAKTSVVQISHIYNGPSPATKKLTKAQDKVKKCIKFNMVDV